MVWGSLPIVIYGLLQSVDIDPLQLQGADAFRIAAMAGEAEMLGHYLMLMLPLTVGRGALVSDRWWLRLTYLLLALGQLICLLLSGPISAYIGVAVALILALAARAVATKKEWTVWLGLFALLSIVVFLALLGVRDGPLAPLARLPGLKRLASLIEIDAPATAGWFAVWRATRPLITARPLLGYGPETMRSVFARVLPPQLVYFEGQETVIDRARNVWLDLLMTSGIVGLVTFTALVAAIGRQARREVRRSTSERWQHIAWAIVLGTVIGHLVDLQMGFDLTISAMPFWLVLGMGAALGTNFRSVDEPALPAQDQMPAWKRRALAASFPTHADPADTVAHVPERDDASSSSGRRRDALALWGSVPLTLGAGVLIAVLCVRPLQADVAAADATQIGSFALRREEAARSALRLWPYEPVYYLNLAGILRSIGDYDGAEEALLTAVDLASSDPRIWRELGDLYVRWSNRDPDRLSEAAEAYRQAVDLAPNSAALHTELGLALAGSGHPDEAVLYLEQAVAFDVSDARAWSRLAEVYAALGQESDAAWAAEEAERWAVD
jgi:O-antigen ligase